MLTPSENKWTPSEVASSVVSRFGGQLPEMRPMQLGGQLPPMQPMQLMALTMPRDQDRLARAISGMKWLAVLVAVIFFALIWGSRK
jgi:hypothetical protein